MKRLNRLREEADTGARWRGHELRWSKPAGSYARQTQVGTCINCGREAFVDTLPPPNGIDISGEAVALSCGD